MVSLETLATFSRFFFTDIHSKLHGYWKEQSERGLQTHSAFSCMCHTNTYLSQRAEDLVCHRSLLCALHGSQ